nr:hypothetical protein [Lipingzhangella halophila]
MLGRVAVGVEVGELAQQRRVVALTVMSGRDDLWRVGLRFGEGVAHSWGQGGAPGQLDPRGAGIGGGDGVHGGQERDRLAHLLGPVGAIQGGTQVCVVAQCGGPHRDLGRARVEVGQLFTKPLGGAGYQRGVRGDVIGDPSGLDTAGVHLGLHRPQRAFRELMSPSPSEAVWLAALILIPGSCAASPRRM